MTVLYEFIQIATDTLRHCEKFVLPREIMSWDEHDIAAVMDSALAMLKGNIFRLPYQTPSPQPPATSRR
jgi:hypothetical protein